MGNKYEQWRQCGEIYEWKDIKRERVRERKGMEYFENLIDVE